MVGCCSGDGLGRMVLSPLGCATRSVQNFVRTEHRTGSPSPPATAATEPCNPSQVAASPTIPLGLAVESTRENGARCMRAVGDQSVPRPGKETREQACSMRARWDRFRLPFERERTSKLGRTILNAVSLEEEPNPAHSKWIWQEQPPTWAIVGQNLARIEL